MYIMTTTARRKNAKRHIDARGNDIEKMKHLASFFPANYDVDIWTGDWKHVWSREGKERSK